MGLFDTFKKPKTETPAPAPAKTEMPDAQPDVTLDPTVDTHEILSILQSAVPGGDLVGEQLVYKQHDLHIGVHFGDMRYSDEGFNVQLLLIAQHPFFDEELVESVSGVGRTADAAIRKAAANAGMVLPLILQAFDSKSDVWLTSEIMGHSYRFRVPVECGALHAGIGEPTDLWELVKDEIQHYLGTKRCYWIRMFSASVNGIPSCEVRINGAVCPDITDRLYTDVLKYKDTKGLVVDKAFMLLIQDEATYKPCPFTKQEVGEATFRAFRLIQNIQDEGTSRKVQRQIVESVPQHSLGIELMSFLPEIVAHQVVRFRDSDSLMPVVERGKPDVELRKTQVRSFGYIEDAVFQYLQKQNPTEDEIRQVLAVSAKFHALSEAMEQNIPIEELKMSQLVYFVDRDYQVW